MSNIVLTIPLSGASVLRATATYLHALADTEDATGGITPAPTAVHPEGWTDTRAWKQLQGKVTDDQGIIRSILGVEYSREDLDAIDYLCNEFDYGFNAPAGEVAEAPETVSTVVDMYGNLIVDGKIIAPTPPPVPGVPASNGDYTPDQIATAFTPPMTPVTTALPPATPPAPPTPPTGVQIAPATPPTPPVIPSNQQFHPMGGVQLDGEGLPWDSRIHASTKTFRQSDNTWKLKKGADPAEVERVKRELRGVMAAPVPPTPPVAPPLPQPAAPVQPEIVQHLSGSYSHTTGVHTIGIPTPPPVATVAPVATPVATPVAPPPPMQAGPSPTMSFPDFVQWATGRMAAKELTRDMIERACTEHGITALSGKDKTNASLLENRPDLIPVIYKFLKALCVPFDQGGTP